MVALIFTYISRLSIIQDAIVDSSKLNSFYFCSALFAILLFVSEFKVILQNCIAVEFKIQNLCGNTFDARIFFFPGKFRKQILYDDWAQK